LGGIFKFLVRFIFILVIGVGLGLLIYYGSVALYQGWVRQSQQVQRNSALITILQERLDREHSFGEDLQTQVASLEADLSELQAVSEEHTETIAVMDQAITHLDRRVGQNQQRIEQESLALQAQLDEANDTLDDIQEAADAYVAKLETAEAEIAALNAALEAEQDAVVGAMNAADQDDVLALETQVAAFEKRLILFQIAQDLLKLRLAVLEEPTGAEGLLTESAASHLDQAIELMPTYAETLSTIRERVLALNPLLAENSAGALTELDALWTDLMEVMTEISTS
jgi:chromosome segregation ATPase